MARIYVRSSTGQRTPLLASPVRMTRSSANIDIHDAKYILKQSISDGKPISPTRSRPSQRTVQSLTQGHNDNSSIDEISTEDDASNDGDNDDDDEDDEDDDESDEEPSLFAPSYVAATARAGRHDLPLPISQISPLEYERGLFGNSDDDDDEIYEAVNYISDYEDDVREEDVEAQELQDILLSESEDDPTTVLDHIDGLSVLGFGGDADIIDGVVSNSDESASIPDVTVERHVHFQSDIDRSSVLNVSASPLLTRALLPSALPENYQYSIVQHERPSSQQIQADSLFEDPDDSDATDEDLPAEAHTTPIALHRTFIDLENPFESTGAKFGTFSKQPSSRRRGPRRGFFQVDKDKPWAILDPSGRKIVLLPAPETDRHDWLDSQVQASLGTSANTSPAATFSQLLDESDQSVTSSQEQLETLLESAAADVMLASLNSNGPGAGERGQATGPSEAFYPPPDYQVIGDYLVGPDDIDHLGGHSDISNEADLPITMDDLIAFDDDGPSDGDDSPTSPAIYMPPLHELSGSRDINEEFAHLNNRNVTAFRRSADQAHAASARGSQFSTLNSVRASLQSTPSFSQKRKATNPPYQDNHYKGVTPVQRKIIGTTKRRKMTV